MTLYESISKTYETLKTKPLENKQQIQILKLLISELQRRPNLKEIPSDDFIIKIINKCCKNNREMLKYVKENDKRKLLEFENVYLSSFLPQMASEEDIKNFMVGLDLTKKDGVLIGETIGEFKARKVLIDGRLVKQVLQSLKEK